MGNISAIVALISEVIALIGILTPIIVKQRKLGDGIKCQLRSDMLRIYYRHKDQGQIRQYEYENFIFLYDAYKALKGNSFVDEIHEKVMKWEVIS